MPTFQLSIQKTISAAHAIVIQGVRERVHGHDWQVTVVVEGQEVDGDGLLCDFHRLEKALEAILAPFQSANLNEEAPFTKANPTAENVARHIATAIATHIPPPARLHSVRVTEAPGCTATYLP